MMLSVAIAPQQLEAALAAGELACPERRAALTVGYARSREVRLAGEVGLPLSRHGGLRHPR